MKPIKLYIFLFFLVSITVRCQTEKETIDFLNNKLALYTSKMVDDPAYFKVGTGNDYGKVIIIDLYISGKLFDTMKFHCDQITAITTMRNGLGYLCLKLVSNSGLIVLKLADESKETFISDIILPLETADEEVYRIRKAFEHLFKLNGMKVVNDNLFKN